ncbi:hypothetical protein PBRA_009713, partial [Plasmodiophora brassicae]
MTKAGAIAVGRWFCLWSTTVVGICCAVAPDRNDDGLAGWRAQRATKKMVGRDRTTKVAALRSATERFRLRQRT